MHNFLCNADRLYDLPVMEKAKLIPRDGSIQDRFKSDSSQFGYDLIYQIAKGDRPVIGKGGRFITFWYESDKSGIKFS